MIKKSEYIFFDQSSLFYKFLNFLNQVSFEKKIKKLFFVEKKGFKKNQN